MMTNAIVGQTRIQTLEDWLDRLLVDHKFGGNYSHNNNKVVGVCQAVRLVFGSAALDIEPGDEVVVYSRPSKKGKQAILTANHPERGMRTIFNDQRVLVRTATQLANRGHRYEFRA